MKKVHLIILLVTAVVVALSACSQAPAAVVSSNVTEVSAPSGAVPSANPIGSLKQAATVASANATEYRLENTLVTTASPDEFVKVTAPLTLNDTEPGTTIPWGSTVYHWSNNITEVYGPDGHRLFIARDAEATRMPQPGGNAAPATFIIQVPSNSHIDRADIGGAASATTVTLHGSVILRILTMPEDFPLVP